MFEKIPSLKDFIIYVTPGILICYFGLDIFNNYNRSVLNAGMILKDSTLSFIGILFSFVIGFIFSQLQIIIFGYFLKKRFENMRTIKESQQGNLELQKTLINRIKAVFDIDGDNIENDNLIVFTCLNFIKIKTNEASDIFIERCNNLSSFAMSTLLPILLFIWVLSIKMKFSSCTISIILSISLAFLVVVIRKIAINFKDDFYKNIFRQFIVLSKGE